MSGKIGLQVDLISAGCVVPQLVESKDWRMRLNIQKRTMTMLEILDLLHLFFHLSHSTLNKKKNLVHGDKKNSGQK